MLGQLSVYLQMTELSLLQRGRSLASCWSKTHRLKSCTYLMSNTPAARIGVTEADSVSNMICAVAGMTADANILINYARQAAQRYLLTYNEDIPCEQLVRRLCDLKQGYTQHGGLRPFGVSFIYAGYDPHRQFQLYQSNPSGNYGGWKATSVGANNASAQSLLKQDYKEDCDLKEACGLAVKVLSKTMDSTKLSSEKSTFSWIS